MPDSSGPPAPGAPQQRRSLWRNGDFMRLWGGETLSQTGSQVSVVALPLIAVITLHAGAGVVGLLTTAQYAPILIVSAFVGAWLGTHRSRPVLITAHLTRAVLIALVPVAYALGVLSVGLLLVVAFAIGLMTAAFDVTYVSYLPQLVSREQLLSANARLETTYSIAEIGGPGVGGLLVQAVSAPLAPVANAVTYLLAGILGLGIKRTEEPQVRAAGSGESWTRAIGQGAAVIWRDPVLRPLAVQSAIFNLLGQVPFTLFLLYGVCDLHLVPGVLGLLLSAGSVGALLGAMLAGRIARSIGTGRTIAWAMVISSVPLAAVPAASGDKGAVIGLLAAGLMLSGFGVGVFNVHSLNLRAHVIPPALLSRATGTWRVITNGTLPLNGLVAAGLGQVIGVRWAMAAAVALLAACCAVFLFSGVRRITDDAGVLTIPPDHAPEQSRPASERTDPAPAHPDHAGERPDPPVGAPGGEAAAAELLALASRESPLVGRLLRCRPGDTIAAYLEGLCQDPPRALQSRDALWDAVREQAGACYGARLACQAVEELRADPVIPTSNHFGLDTFADSFQGTVLTALRDMPGGHRRRTVVVLGCGSVSLENLTYPMGLLLYDAIDGVFPGQPCRLPVVASRYRRHAVSAAPPLSAGGLEQVRRRLAGLRQQGRLSRFCHDAAGTVLDECVAVPRVLALPTYGQQAATINSSLWRRVLPERSAELLQLELEAVCASVAATDLSDQASLLHRLLFTPEVRQALLTRLDGAPACWRLDDLRRRLSATGAPGPALGGTLFFWGLTPRGRRVPLTLVSEPGPLRLAGRDERGQVWEWDATPEAISSGLRQRVLLPSLITCFTVLAFARGVVCLGGYYQASYLPLMRNGVADAIRVQDPGAADLVAAVPAATYLASLQFVTREAGRYAVPAGPVELAAAGGLTEDQLDRIRSLPVREAALTALLEVLPHVVPAGRLPDGWPASIGSELLRDCRNVLQI